MRRVDLMCLAQLFEERIDAEQAARAVHEQQRIAAAEFPHLDRKLTAEKFLGGFHCYFALRVSALAPLGRAWPLVCLGNWSSNCTCAGTARSLTVIGLADHLSS